jgi:hypothetical protein
MDRNLYNQLKEKLYNIYWNLMYSKVEALAEEYIEEHSDYFLEVIEQDLKSKIIFKKAEIMFNILNYSEGFPFKLKIKNALRSYLEKIYFEEFYTEASLTIKAFIKAVDKQEIEANLVEKHFKKLIKALIEKHVEKIQREHENRL